MNLLSSFKGALISSPKIPSTKKAEDFLGQVYLGSDAESSPLFRLLAGGNLHISSPWSFDIRSIDCFLLLYTKKGCGKLLLNSQVYSLNADTLLLLDCGQRFRIDIAIAPWEYQIAFISSDSLPYYRQLFPKERYSLIPASSYSEMSMCMEKLAVLTPGNSTARKLMISSLINQIVSGCLTAVLMETAADCRIPSYLEDIRSLFDNDFQEIYTLDGLEKRFGISKYRLCREFSSFFHVSPLQYLNRRRIDVAKHLLCTTKYRIHEIGSMVGIDNTNHFITLFKKYTDTTPLEYRQRMTF